jgi:hypothetical protein
MSGLGLIDFDAEAGQKKKKKREGPGYCNLEILFFFIPFLSIGTSFSHPRREGTLSIPSCLPIYVPCNAKESNSNTR